MIKTEIFCYDSPSNYICFDEVLKDINKLIKEEHIKRNDILEYHTKNWSTIEKVDIMWHYEAIISYWVDKDEEDD